MLSNWNFFYLKEHFYGKICILAMTLSYDINKLKGPVNSGSPFILLVIFKFISGGKYIHFSLNKGLFLHWICLTKCSVCIYRSSEFKASVIDIYYLCFVLTWPNWCLIAYGLNASGYCKYCILFLISDFFLIYRWNIYNKYCACNSIKYLCITRTKNKNFQSVTVCVDKYLYNLVSTAFSIA